MTADASSAQEGPLVSVVIPVYNRRETIERAIWSVLNQTYDNIEVLVVDDGSTDGTRTLVEDIDDDRVELIEHEENKGATAARNTGIDAAAGEFVAFQDSDDEWQYGKLRKQMDVFRDAPDDVGVVYTGFLRLGDDYLHYHPDDRVATLDGDLSEQLLEVNPITTQATVVRRECFEAVGDFHEGLPAQQDWELWLRIAEEYEFRCVDEHLVTAYLQDDSLTVDRQSVIHAVKIILNKHDDKFEGEHLARKQFNLAHRHMKGGEYDAGREYLRKAVRVRPTPVRAVAYLASALSGELYLQLADAFIRVRGAVNCLRGEAER